MAARIVDAGLPLTVWARRPEALEPYVAKGAVAASSIEELGAVCDHVGICVVNDADVDEVMDRLLPSMRAGSRIAVHSTILPEHCIALAERCAEKGVQLLDAPVSGGGQGAAAGTLTVMCGGSAATYEASKPLFETFGSMIVLLGDVGAGQRAKIINNTLLAANMGLAHASVIAAQALGLEREPFQALIKESSGRSFGFEVYARQANPQAFAVGAPLLQKDMKLLMGSLPNHAATDVLCHAASPYLAEANGKPSILEVK